MATTANLHVAVPVIERELQLEVEDLREWGMEAVVEVQHLLSRVRHEEALQVRKLELFSRESRTD